MPDTTITKAQRWLDLIAFLVGRRFPITRSEIYRGVPAYAAEQREGDTDPESLRKKFLRDKAELFELGIVIDTRELRGHDVESHGYMIRRDSFHLPYLRLLAEADPTRTEANPGSRTIPYTVPETIEVPASAAWLALDSLRALAHLPEFPWRNDARSAWRKLSFDLVPDPDTAQWSTHIAAREAPTVIARLEQLSQALNQRRQVRFTYRGMSDTRPAPRSVEPRGLLFKNNRWYLVAFDLDRSGLRTFRLSRMDDVEIDTHSRAPQYEVPADFSLDAWLDAQPWDLPNEELERAPITVRFELPRSIWAEHNRLGELVQRTDDGGQLRRFKVRQHDAFLRWVLSLQGEAQIVAPDEAVTAWHDLAQSVANLYRDVHRDAHRDEEREVSRADDPTSAPGT